VGAREWEEEAKKQRELRGGCNVGSAGRYESSVQGGKWGTGEPRGAREISRLNYVGKTEGSEGRCGVSVSRRNNQPKAADVVEAEQRLQAKQLIRWVCTCRNTKMDCSQLQ